MTTDLFALVDCNNFFVSCERLFRPDLEGRPVVVLSSNDGCAVARSNEAKALGIPMGAPAFQYRELFKKNEVVSFSGNFELYGDISQRVTNTLRRITPKIEVYSVDESFLDLSALDIANYDQWARDLRARILHDIGIPVSVGIAPTKTLCKVAVEHAKKLPELRGGLALITTPVRKKYCAQTPIADVWGVGRKLTPKLKSLGVHSAQDLAELAPRYAQQLMGIHGRQMVAELGGESCLPLQPRNKPQQVVMRGRQFGQDTNKLTTIETAIANLTARATYHIRQDGQLANDAAVAIQTNRKKPGFRRLVYSVRLSTPSADAGHIAAELLSALEQNFNTQLSYHRADVVLTNLIPDHAVQTDLFRRVESRAIDTSQKRLKALDELNHRFGNGTVKYAAEKLDESWRPRRQHASPRYTTSWQDLPVIYG